MVYSCLTRDTAVSNGTDVRTRITELTLNEIAHAAAPATRPTRSPDLPPASKSSILKTREAEPPTTSSLLSTTRETHRSGKLAESSSSHQSQPQLLQMPISQRIRNLQAIHPRHTHPSLCSCFCHLHGYWQSPKALECIMGCLVVGYSSSLTSQPDCCRCKARHRTLNLHYTFPKLFLYRTIHALLEFKGNAGPPFVLSIFNVRDPFCEVFEAVAWGNPQKAQQLLESKAASPYDIDEDGSTLAFVCLQSTVLHSCRCLTVNRNASRSMTSLKLSSS